MNFYRIQMNTFIQKLKGLIKKISKSSSFDLEAHTQTCHEILIKLVKEQQALQCMNNQQLRLLAYQSILFMVEALNSKSQHMQQIQKALAKNQIEKYLGEIQSTLLAIRQMIKSYEQQKANLGREGICLNLTQKTKLNNLDRNLSQYQLRVGNLLQQFQNVSKINKNQNREKSSPINFEDQKDSLIQEMHSIVEKKQKRISELSKIIKDQQNQRLKLELSLKKQKNQNDAKYSLLQKKLQEQIQKSCNLQKSLKNFARQVLQSRKQELQKKMSIKQFINQRIVNKLQESPNCDFNNKIQALTQQTISSLKIVRGNELQPRNLSLEKVSSLKSFRRIYSPDQKERLASEKRMTQLNEKNQELYRLLLCQASTIQQLF